MHLFTRALLLLTGCGAAHAAATFVNLQLWTCNASNANQQFLVNGTFPRGPFHLISTAPATAGLVWDLNGPSAAAGTIIHLVPKFTDPYPSQQWELLPSGELKTLYAPSMCVTALGAPGAQLQLGPCGGALPFSYAPATRLLSARLDDNTTLCADAGTTHNCSVAPYSGYTYCDRAAAPAARAADAVGRLSAGALVGLLGNNNNGAPELGLAPIHFGEALHGMLLRCLPPGAAAPGSTGCPTSFPHALLLGGTFNRSLWHAVASAISDEGRGYFNAANRSSHIITWAPDINPFRDPRWGRCDR